jgi:ABC-2 type transport system ATP-binding protein
VTAVVQMEGVEKRFRGSLVLESIDWSVPPGSICGLIGPNGAGKTTLLRLALGLLWPDRGSIRVLGEQLGRENAWLRERVHYVASDRAMVPALRVDEWLHYASLAYSRWDVERSLRLLTVLELDPARRIGELSTGQRTSLQILVGIAARPDLLLLDEPTNGLDIVVKTQILQLVLDMAAAEGTTVIFATHHIEDVERVADRLAVLYNGRLLFQDELDAIKASVHRLQVVFPGDWPTALDEDPRVVSVERQGKAALLTIAGPAEPVVDICRNAGALLIEPVDLDLAGVFRAILAKEGYTRAQVHWSLL